MTFEEAASVPFGAITAYHFLTKAGKIEKGQKILVNGASGGVGIFAIQLAKYFGANVTGVYSTGNIEMVKSLGADHVIDYTKEDFTGNSETYDALRSTIFRRALQLPEGKKCRVFDITGRVVVPERIKPGIYFIEVDGKIAQKVKIRRRSWGQA